MIRLFCFLVESLGLLKKESWRFLVSLSVNELLIDLLQDMNFEKVPKRVTEHHLHGTKV